MSLFAACSTGFYGSYCNISCPLGTYGPDCAGVCPPKCLDENCHYKYGCVENATEKTVTIQPGRKCAFCSSILIHWKCICIKYQIRLYLTKANFSTLELTQHTNASCVSLVAQQTHMLLFTEKPVIKNDFCIRKKCSAREKRKRKIDKS